MGFIDAPLKNSRAHPEHPIQLTSVNKPFICDGCYQPGFGFCYRCTEPSGRWGKIFHEECVRPEEINWHPLSKGCYFTFKFSRPNSASRRQNTIYRICDVCCSEVTGSFYACSHKHATHFIHPACIKLDNRIRLRDLHLELKATVPEKCGLCGHRHAFEGMKGWSYVSSCGRLCLHVKCVRKMFLDSWKRMNLGHHSKGSSSSTPEMTITLMARKMIAGAPSGGGAVNDSGKGKEMVVYGGKATFPIKKYAAAGFNALLKMAIPAIVCSIFRVFGAPLF